MKKTLKVLGLLVGIIALGSIVMFLTNTCPPKGPWPTPPWCSGTFERVKYNVTASTVHLNQIKAVNMFDTWGKNYNFSMFEDTRNNIDTSFKRVQELGASEVFVHDFHLAKYSSKENRNKSLDFSIGNDVFINDMRDESMSERDVNNLAKSAHSNNLKIGIKNNLNMFDMRSYVKEGLSGNIGDSLIEDVNSLNPDRSSAWVNHFFDAWQERLVARAKMYQSAGIDYMSVSPGWLGQAFSGNEELVNTRYNELIQAVKKDFTGKIYVELPVYGFLEDKDGQENYLKYDYYKKADMVEVTLYELPQSYKNNSKNTAESQTPLIQKLVKDLNQKAQEKSIKLSINIKFYAYKDALNKGIFEFNDILNPKIKETKNDFDYQKDVYQVVFESLEKANSIERITTGGFWWDDALEPNVKVPVGVTPSIRNKPAEELIKIWFNK